MEIRENRPAVPVMEEVFTQSAPDGHPRLIGSKCSRCGKKLFPKRIICPHCFCDEKMEVVLLGPRGKIYAFTTVRIPPPLGFEIPYSYGYVDLVEDDIRIPTMFAGSGPGQLRIGMDVTLVVDKLRMDKEGNEIIGYKFRPIAELKEV